MASSSNHNCLLTRRIGWLVQFYQHEKPKHREVLKIGVPQESFHPGKLLDQLKKSFLPCDGVVQKPLDEELKEQLFSLNWFQGWLDDLNTKRATGGENGPPGINEQLGLLINNYPTTAPKKGEAVTVQRINGQAFELNGHLLLEKIAHSFHGEASAASAAGKTAVNPSLRNELLQLPWSAEWLCIGRKRREVARLRTLVTKEMKLEMLIFFFPQKKPAWKSRVPVVVPDGSGEIFDFYVGTWLDDLADNFLKQNRPNVVLDAAQQLAVARLPWATEWLTAVREQRKNRGSKKPKRRRSSHDDETDSGHETYESDNSGRSVERPL